MWLQNCFEKVGLRTGSLKNINMNLAVVPKMLEKGNTNIPLIICHHSYYSKYYRYVLSSMVGDIVSKLTRESLIFRTVEHIVDQSKDSKSQGFLIFRYMWSLLMEKKKVTIFLHYFYYHIS